MIGREAEVFDVANEHSVRTLPKLEQQDTKSLGQEEHAGADVSSFFAEDFPEFIS